MRAILLDIDGTITPREGEPSPALAPVLAAARARGIRVACATARTHRAARMRLDALAWVADEGVFYNGAVVLRAGRVAWAAEMPAAIVTGAVAAARAVAPAVVVSIHHPDTAPAFSAEPDERLLAAWGVPVGALRPFTAALAQPAVKLGLWMPGEEPGSIAAVGAAVQAAIGDAATVYRADEDRFVLVTAQGIDKAAGARRWLDLHGIDPAEALAAGDDLTDAPLLTLCGHGIAIAGGHPSALAAATERVAPPPSDALAIALRRLLAGVPIPC